MNIAAARFRHALTVVGVGLLTLAITVPAAAAPGDSRSDAGVAIAQARTEEPTVEPIPGLSVTAVGTLPVSANAQSQYAVRLKVLSSQQSVQDLRLTLSVTEAPLADSAALADFIADPEIASTRRVASTPIGVADATGRYFLAAGDDTAVSAIVEAGGLGLDAEVSGVYGVVVELRTASGVVWRRVAPVTWQPRHLPPLDVTVLATIAGTQERATALLGAASDDRIALAIDPSSLTLSQRLTLSRREAYAIPAGNLDVSSAAHASSASLIESGLAAGRSGMELPWLALAAVTDDATVSVVSRAGALAVVADPRDVPDVTGPIANVIGISSDKPAPLVIPDPVLSRALAGDTPGDPTNPARVYAEAAFAAMRGAKTVVIAPGSAWLVDGARPSRSVVQLLDAPFVTSRTLAAQLSDTERAEVDLPEFIESETDISRGGVIQAASALSALENLAAVTESPSTIIAQARRDLYIALSTPRRLDPERRDELLAEATTNANAVANAVTVTSGSDLTLVSRSGAVPITINNALDVPVNVRVAMTSRSPILRSKDSPLAHIESNSYATVTVPVEAISSGNANVSVAIRTEEGATVAVAETLKVRVRAAWGSAATGVVTAGLVVLLLAGIWRTVKRGRRDTRVVPTATTPLAGASTADE